MRYLKNIAVVLFSTLLTLAFVEAGAWLWVKFVRGEQLPRWEFRATQPVPYQGADYFSAQFLTESETFVNGRIDDVARLKDFAGRYFNVQNGFRVTTDSPKHFSRRVLLFGGSTLFGQEVPDRFTIASALQRLLNDAGQDWKVLNFGLPGMNARQQTQILKEVEVEPGDMVVFYHGVNEIFYIVFGGQEKGWVGGVPAFRPVQHLSPLAKTMEGWHKKLKGFSYTADLALDIYDRSVPDTITDPAVLKRGIDQAKLQFGHAIEEANVIAKNNKARFIHFLQPTAFEASSWSNYEKEILGNYLQTPPGLDIAFRDGYPELRALSSDLEQRGVPFFDISDALESRHKFGEVYLDFCHLNHVGNQLIAEQIFLDLISEK